MKIKNLGPIHEGEINLNKMTVFIGESGSGKTYMSYAIYGIHKHLENEISKLKLINDENLEEFLENKELVLNVNAISEQLFTEAKKSYKEQEKKILGSTFNTSSEMFEKTKIDINYNDFPGLKIEFTEFFFMVRLSDFFFKIDEKIYLLREQVKDNEISILLVPLKIEDLPSNQRIVEDKKILKNSLNDILSKSFSTNRLIYIPAERVGLHVFREELNKARLDDFADLSFNSSKSRDNINIPTYPEPISSYLNNLTQWFYLSKQYFRMKNPKNSEIESIINELLNGKFEINDNEDIFFRERYGKTRHKSQRIPFQISSSTLKSLFGLDLYLRTGIMLGNYFTGDYLVIDEPELNLHLKSQKILASLLYKLMEKGIHVVLSTHSDYLVKELVNLELKNQLKKRKKIMNISCYYFSENKVKKLPPLTDTNYINNFDDSFVSVENEYYKLLNKVENLKNEKSK